MVRAESGLAMRRVFECEPDPFSLRERPDRDATALVVDDSPGEVQLSIEWSDGVAFVVLTPEECVKFCRAMLLASERARLAR